MGEMDQQVALTRTSVLWLVALALGGSLFGSVSAARPHARALAHDSHVSRQSSTQEPLEALPEKPERRRAINGIASVYSKSTLVFPKAPDQRFESEATFVFPDRARWRISRLPEVQVDGSTGTPNVEDRRARSLRFRWGTGIWVVDYGKIESQSFQDEQRRLALLQLELRRVAMIWPAELDWKTTENARTADLPGLGRLQVELDVETGRPRIK